MSRAHKSNRDRATHLSDSALDTLEKATDIAWTMRAVVEVGAGLIKVGLAIDDSLRDIRKSIDRHHKGSF